jgi:hypothetical protein
LAVSPSKFNLTSLCPLAGAGAVSEGRPVVRRGFLDAMEQGGQRYFVEVPADTTAWAEKPLRQTPDEFVRQVRLLAATLPSPISPSILTALSVLRPPR